MKADYYEVEMKFKDFCENNDIDKKKYFLSYADKRSGKLVAIMEHQQDGGISLCGGGGQFYSFDALIAWMTGYMAAKKSIIFK